MFATLSQMRFPLLSNGLPLPLPLIVTSQTPHPSTPPPWPCTWLPPCQTARSSPPGPRGRDVGEPPFAGRCPGVSMASRQQIDIGGAPRQLLGILARHHAQHQQIGNGLGIPSLLLHRLLQRGLRLFCPAEMQLGDGLRDETPHRRRRGCLRELLEDVKRLLVLVAPL